MKSVLYIGNCQAAAVMHRLETHQPYKDKYISIKSYANWEMINNNHAIPIKDIKKADVIIYQPLSDVHGCYSTNKKNSNSMFQFIKDDALTISFPRIHNNSFWPIYKKSRDRSNFYGIEGINELYNNKVSKDSIVSLYDNGNLDFKFEERYLKNKFISLEKEKDTDIKIFDIIDTSKNKTQLFLTQDHPTSYIIYNVINQICKILDIDTIYYDESIDDNVSGLPDSIYSLPGDRFPISKYSIDFFKFNYLFNNFTDPHSFYRNNLISYLNNLS